VVEREGLGFTTR